MDNSINTSPLKRLQNHLASSGLFRRNGRDQALSTNAQTEDHIAENSSLYLYESSEWSEFDLAKRDSIVSVKSTGRLLDKLGLDDDDFISGKYSQPERRKSKPLSRGLSFTTPTQLRIPVDQKQPQREPSVKDVQLRAILNKNRSIDSFVADMQTNNDAEVPQYAQVQRQASNSKNRPDPTVKDIQHKPILYNRNHSHDSFIADVSDSQSIETLLQLPRTPKMNHGHTFGPFSSSSPHTRSVSESVHKTNASPSTPTRRIISDSGIVNTSPGNREIDPETRIAAASQLRALGRHREALYQLQIAANSPFHNTRAMYLYALALHVGQGVKQNDMGSVKWLCKLILLHGLEEVPENVAAQYNEQPIDTLISMVGALVQRDPPVDPLKLYQQYSDIPTAKLSKIAIKNSVPAAYHELGTFLIHGYGLKKDETLGMQFLAKAGSLGAVASMVQLGELWSVKTKHHRKDYHKAAAWLRLGELFGHKSIGNSWIYKDKYM